MILILIGEAHNANKIRITLYVRSIENEILMFQDTREYGEN